MKKAQFLYTVLILLHTFHVVAQKDSLISAESKQKPLFELGMNIYGLTVRAGDFYTQYNKVWDNQIFSGIYLRRYIGKNAWRTSLDYSRRAAYYGKNAIGRYIANKGELASLEIKFGYQRLLSVKKFSPYLFADAEYTLFRPISYPTYDYLYLTNSALPYYYNYRWYTLSGSFISISPGIGLRWSVSTRIFINAEVAAQLFYSHERSSGTYENINSIGANAKPLKLSVGFKF